MNGQLAARVAVVTGGASGIGRAVAEVFAHEGAAVMIADVAPTAAETVRRIESAGGRASAVRADVTKSNDVASVIRETERTFGKIDILVNNAFAAEGEGFLETAESAWDATITGVLKGAYLCTRAVLPSMIQNGGGVIINVASVNALGFYGNDAYSAAKSAVLSLTRATAVRYGPRGIRANAVAPGSVRTPASEEYLATDPERLTRWYPLGRIGEPIDIARAVLFLASDQSAWITGIVLPVDGGLLAGNSEFANAVEDLQNGFRHFPVQS